MSKNKVIKGNVEKYAELSDSDRTKMLISDMSELLVSDRQKDYGNAVDTHRRIAKLWSAILDHPVSAQDVASMMIALKIIRSQKSPQKIDSYLDMANYSLISGLVAIDDFKTKEDLMENPIPESEELDKLSSFLIEDNDDSQGFLDISEENDTF